MTAMMGFWLFLSRRQYFTDGISALAKPCGELREGKRALLLGSKLSPLQPKCCWQLPYELLPQLRVVLVPVTRPQPHRLHEVAHCIGEV